MIYSENEQFYNINKAIFWIDKVVFRHKKYNYIKTYISILEKQRIINYNQIFQLCLTGSENGSTYCMYRVSDAYLNGRGVVKDICKAEEYIKKAYGLNKVWAFEYCKVLLLTHDLSKREIALNIYKELADKGDRRASIMYSKISRNNNDYSNKTEMK